MRLKFEFCTLIIDSSPSQKRFCSSLETLNAQFPLHCRLARLVALDGLSFFVFENSPDLREFAISFLEKNKIPTQLPLSQKTVKTYIMQYAGHCQEIVKQVIIYYTVFLKNTNFEKHFMVHGFIKFFPL